MGNYFHLVVETPQTTLVAGMKWFLGTYTQRFNVRHRLWGHLFSGRYKALLLVDGSEDFVERLVDMGAMEKAKRSIHRGDAVFETMEEKARRLIRQMLGQRKVEIEELRTRPKGEKLKIQIAASLKKQTTVTVGWIARELDAGAPQTLWSARRKLHIGDKARD